jgi:hypothetical protein
LSALLELSQILNPAVLDEALPPIMPVGVYCDESASSVKPYIFTLAGWMATPTAWGTFNNAWRDLLSCGGPSAVRAFHMADLGARRSQGEFKRWKRRERVEFVNRATEIMLDKRIMAIPIAFAASIDIDALRQRVPSWSPSEKTLYVLCFSSIFHQVITHGVQQSIGFVMDEKKAVQKHAADYFYLAKDGLERQGAPDKVNGFSFADDRLVLPLQAADLLAFQVRRGIFNRRRDAVYKEAEPYAKLKQREHSFRCYGKRFASNLDAAMRAEPHRSIHELWFEVDAPEED